MYEEEGYSRRDIPRLILEKNLTGLEIDPRAAAMASFALTMKGVRVRLALPAAWGTTENNSTLSHRVRRE